MVKPDMVIRPEPLTREAFRPFGDVIEMAGRDAELINQGNTEKYADLATLAATHGGRIALHLYRSRVQEPPIAIKSMERHPLGSQAFIPLHDRPFPVVVAAAGPAPVASDIRVFLTNGRQGINLHAGTWHHYQLSLGQRCDYLVVDRVGGGVNLEETELAETLTLQV